MKRELIILFCLMPLLLPAQQSENTFNGYLTYAEIGGLAGFFSVNIEQTLFKAGRFNGGVRVGYGQFRFNEGHTLFRGIPAALVFFRHQGNHHSDFGFGVSYISGMQYEIEPYSGYANYSQALFAGPMAGYRFQKPDGGIFFRIQYIPLVKVRELSNDALYKSYQGKLFHSPGIAVGYFFSKQKK